MTALYVKLNISKDKATCPYTREATSLGAKWKTTLTSREWRCLQNNGVDANWLLIFVSFPMPAIQCARRFFFFLFFHSYLKETKKINNQFLIIYFHIIFIQNLRANSRKISKTQTEQKAQALNLPTAMAEWLFNFELPSLKEFETPKQTLFKLFPFLFCQWRFHAFFVFDSSVAVVKLFTMT